MEIIKLLLKILLVKIVIIMSWNMKINYYMNNGKVLLLKNLIKLNKEKNIFHKNKLKKNKVFKQWMIINLLNMMKLMMRLIIFKYFLVLKI